MNKEEYDRKKLEKESAKQRGKQQKQFKKIVVGVVLLIVIGLGAYLLVSLQEPLGKDSSQEMPYEGATHVAEGIDVQYQSNPPTSGSHWPVPLKDGVYETEKPDEAIVHSMEHGRVWISYKPTIPDSVKEALEDFKQAQVIITPRAANDTDIALAAWQRLDAFNLENGQLDAKRVKDFISRYKNKGPEYIPSNAGASDYQNY